VGLSGVGGAVRAYFLPKSNATFRSKGVASWVEMLVLLVSEPQKWFESCHMRSISELLILCLSAVNLQRFERN